MLKGRLAEKSGTIFFICLAQIPQRSLPWADIVGVPLFAQIEREEQKGMQAYAPRQNARRTLTNGTMSKPSAMCSLKRSEAARPLRASD